MSDQPSPGPATHVVAAPEALQQIARALDSFCASERLPDADAWKLRVCLDEIVANIVAHGVTSHGVPEIDVWFRRTEDVVEIVIADNGPPFNPVDRRPPDLAAPLEARTPGGLGITLVKGLMDDVHYERQSGNVLTLRKIISGERRPDAD